MNKRDGIAAAILAGGQSSRMGKDKALLELNGVPFIRRVAEVLSEEFTPVIVISDHNDRYNFLSLSVYEDERKNCGPLGGIHTALKNVPTTRVFIASCDIPFINRYVLRHLLDARGEEDVTIFSTNGLPQPLFGLYDRRILPALEEHLKSNRFSVLDFLGDVRTAHVTPPPDNIIAHALLNINTPAEYLQYCYETDPDRLDGLFKKFEALKRNDYPKAKHTVYVQSNGSADSLSGDR